MEERELAYIAGFLDADGCISCEITNKNKDCEGIGFRLTLTNTNKEVLEWMQSLIGGHINDKSKGKANWKQSYHLRLRQKEMQKIVPLLLPYLRVKKAQAQIYLNYVEGVYQDKLSKDDVYYQMKELNKRGRDVNK